MDNYDGLNTPMIALVGFFSSLLVFAIFILSLTFFHIQNDAEYYRKVVSQRNEELVQVVTNQKEQLYGYRLINEASQTVAIPIDVAMELVVNELNQTEE